MATAFYGSAFGHDYSHITGGTTAQTVKALPGILWRVIAANPSGSAATITIKDGNDTVNVVSVAAGASVSLDYEVDCLTNISITPSVSSLDICVVYS